MRDPAASTWFERTVDGAVALIAPRRAVIRQHLRRMDRDPDYRETFLLGMRARGYRNARASTQATPWTGIERSPDAENYTDLQLLRARSQELNRDDPIGAGVTQTFADNVIGTGISPQARTGDPKKDSALEAVWRTRRPSLYLGAGVGESEGQRLVFRKLLEDGGILIKKAKRTPDEPVWFELVEACRVDIPVYLQGAIYQNGRVVYRGVEKDEYGIPVAYHVRVSYPVEAVNVPTQFKTVRVPVEDAIYPKLLLRPGATHGTPMFHPILQDFRDLDLLLLASLKRVQIAACLSIFIKSPQQAATLFDVTAEQYGYKLDQALEPGMIFKLYPEESIDTVSPNFPTPELVPFIITFARRIGSALGVSWQVVLKDFSTSNYSAARTDLLEARQRYGVFQHYMIENVLSWQWRTVMEDARLLGDPRMRGIAPEDVEAVQWIVPGWRWVDPQKEAAATQITLAIGLTTLRDEAAALGKDWQDLVRQTLAEEKFERALRAEMGLPDPDEKDEPVAEAKDEEEDRTIEGATWR